MGRVPDERGVARGVGRGPICELMGVPASEREQVKEIIDTTFHVEPGVGMVNDVSLTTMIELDAYFAQPAGGAGCFSG